MEENTAIQLLQMDGKVLVDSRIVAKGIGIQHHNLMQTIYTYQTELEEFDQLQFETEVGYRPQGGGNPIKYALLNRNQIGVVTSLSRNTAQVVRFKVDLFKAIDKMEKELAETKEQLADAMATLGELRGMLQAILQGDVDTLAVMKASASLAPAMLNSINAALDILAEEHQSKVLSTLAEQQQFPGTKTALCSLDYTPESISARILVTMRTLGPGWHSSGAITHAGDPVLESIGISRTGGQLYRLFAAGMLLRQEKEGNALYRLVTEK